MMSEFGHPSSFMPTEPQLVLKRTEYSTASGIVSGQTKKQKIIPSFEGFQKIIYLCVPDKTIVYNK
jgi:hypothetical protein